MPGCWVHSGRLDRGRRPVTRTVTLKESVVVWGNTVCVSWRAWPDHPRCCHALPTACRAWLAPILRIMVLLPPSTRSAEVRVRTGARPCRGPLLAAPPIGLSCTACSEPRVPSPRLNELQLPGCNAPMPDDGCNAGLPRQRRSPGPRGRAGWQSWRAGSATLVPCIPIFFLVFADGHGAHPGAAASAGPQGLSG